MKIVKVVAVMLLGPLLGILAGVVLALLKLPPNTSDVGRAPGDGFLIMMFAFVGLVVSIPVSGALALAVWRRSGTAARSN